RWPPEAGGRPFEPLNTQKTSQKPQMATWPIATIGKGYSSIVPNGRTTRRTLSESVTIWVENASDQGKNAGSGRPARTERGSADPQGEGSRLPVPRRRDEGVSFD